MSAVPSGVTVDGNCATVPCINCSAVPVPSDWPPEQASRSAGTAECARRVDHGLSVRCPDAILLERRLERQTLERFTRQMPDPDVVFLITNIKRDASPVG